MPSVLLCVFKISGASLDEREDFVLLFFGFKIVSLFISSEVFVVVDGT